MEIVKHTSVRIKELRFEAWREIDGDIGRIAAARIKKKRDLTVPLTPQSLAILAKPKASAGDSKWILPGRNGKPMSETTMLYALYRRVYHGRASIHSFRGLASAVLNESGLWSTDAIKKQLSHEPTDKVRRAYNAAQFLPERRRMLEWWSLYIEAAAKKSSTDLSEILLVLRHRSGPPFRIFYPVWWRTT